MCHERWQRRDERAEDARSDRLWNLFYRETGQAPPPTPVAERDEQPEPESERALAGSARQLRRN